MIDVSVINKKQKIAILTNNMIVPITKAFDDLGNECEIQQGIIFVCGSDATGWFVFEEQELEYQTTQ